MASEMSYRVKEKSWIARIAAWKLNATGVAIVFGNTIHLYNTTREDFLRNDCWLKHELCHVRQYREHGFFGFIWKYLLESIRHGYYNNKFEVEARQAELLD
jgi:predicted SprT family Zn-dependent metalloprotease